MIESEYLEFLRADPLTARKTSIVYVISKSSGDELGLIKWYGPWRQFCFWPALDTIFNVGCLEEIQTVIKLLMDERK